MTKESLMEKVKAYILDGTESWEDVRNYMAYNVKGFTRLLNEHSLTPLEFHCVMPFLKEVIFYAPSHSDDDEDLNELDRAIIGCRDYYHDSMADTPMAVLINSIYELIKTHDRELNTNIELLIAAILMKSKEKLEEEGY